MIACAIVCYAAAAGIVLFLPSLTGAGGAQVSLLDLMQPDRGGLWTGVLLFALAATGIVLAAIKTKVSVHISAAAACAGAVAGAASLLMSKITAQNLGSRIAALLLPLLFVWAAICCGMFLYLHKRGEGAGENE
jgi:hypothetical protein